MRRKEEGKGREIEGGREKMKKEVKRKEKKKTHICKLQEFKVRFD